VQTCALPIFRVRVRVLQERRRGRRGRPVHRRSVDQELVLLAFGRDLVREVERGRERLVEQTDRHRVRGLHRQLDRVGAPRGTAEAIGVAPRRHDRRSTFGEELELHRGDELRFVAMVAGLAAADGSYDAGAQESRTGRAAERSKLACRHGHAHANRLQETMQVAIDLRQRFYPRILVTMKSLSREALTRQLHDAGLRATPPRLAALRLLRTADRPLSHAEVVAELASEDWDQATIYRNLVKLVEARLARVATQVAGVTRYEASHPREAPDR